MPLAIAFALAALLAAGGTPARARHFHPLAPVRHLALHLETANVRLTILPDKPRAGQSTMVGIELTQRDNRPPPGSLIARIEREGPFGRRTTVVPNRTIAHDAGWPGEYTLRVAFPASGLYWIYLRAPSDRTEHRMGLGVWPRRGRPLILLPAAALAAVLALAVARWRRRMLPSR